MKMVNIIRIMILNKYIKPNKKFFENGVIFVRHLVNENGEYHTYNDFKQIYKNNCDFLTYYS